MARKTSTEKKLQVRKKKLEMWENELRAKEKMLADSLELLDDALTSLRKFQKLHDTPFVVIKPSQTTTGKIEFEPCRSKFDAISYIQGSTEPENCILFERVPLKRTTMVELEEK